MTNQCTQNTQGVRSICHKCAYIKSPAELAYYGSYRLCRECAWKFSIMTETGMIQNIEDFVMIE